MRRMAIILLSIGFAAAMSAAEPKDKFTEYFEKLTTNSAPYRNCGRVAIGGSRVQSDNCVLQAFAAGEAFFVRYDKQGIDSNVAEGLVLSHEKSLAIIHFDDWSCSTPYCTRSESCGSPKITRTKNGIHVQCSNEYDP